VWCGSLSDVTLAPSRIAITLLCLLCIFCSLVADMSDELISKLEKDMQLSEDVKTQTNW